MMTFEMRAARRHELQRELTYWWQMIPVEDMAKIVEQAEDAIAQALEKMRDLPDAAVGGEAPIVPSPLPARAGAAGRFVHTQRL